MLEEEKRAAYENKNKNYKYLHPHGGIGIV